mmetsp:Transcript_3669/g.9367  ORF Transcript_3669/g.9367 Transcript_3669/m.9367 type:complete len:232 (-) Transcript_3669:127-822(-)|eukprot:CAMPEP_0117544182 /NCGR_PEP_ID=MMETSP0784-20121206/45440_1 /TAXON_ID=39447 /ORGANISM="" /LENGTH=231 /DNA_ID=CAMNT_0005340975 /DNA_START=63 /DNA_END=758 /DNA_ORIENTATION=+
MAGSLAPGPGMTLYHSKDARSFRPLWMLHELGVADQCRLVTMPFPPRAFVREYLDLNVLGTIPYFRDEEGRVQMTESCAIPQYLAEKFAPTSLQVQPSEPDWPAYLNWIAHADATLTFPQTVVLRYTLQEKGRADKAAEDYGKWYVARLRLLDSVLSDGREFLCSGRMTIADICVVYALMLGVRFGFDQQYKPQTKAYLERMTSRPAFKAAHAHQEASAIDFQAAVQQAKL